MVKNNFVLFSIILLFLFSCSNSKTTQDNQDNDLNNSATENNNQENNSENNNYDTVDETDHNGINYGIVKSKYKLSKSIIDLINDNLTIIESLERDNVPESVEKDPEGVNDVKTNIARPLAMLVNNVNINENMIKYVEKLFPQYLVLAQSKFVSSKAVSNLNIQRFAAYINSNLVVVKKAYDPDTSKYIYDIVFLMGDIYGEDNFWYRGSNEAVPLVDSMNALNIADLNSYLNIVNDPKEIPDSLKEDKILLDGLTNEYQNEEELASSSDEASIDNQDETSQPENGIETSDEATTNDQDVSDEEANQPENDTETSDEAPANDQDIANDQDVADQEVTQPENDPALDQKALLEKEELLQNELINFRLNNIIGYWTDLNNKEIYLIREIQSPNSKNKHYGAYLILENDAKKLKVNSSLSWINEDLKFEFYLNKNKNDVYINHEKMPTFIRVTPLEGKSVLGLFLPNQEIRYLAPVLPGIKKDFYDKKYENIIKIKPRQTNYSKKRGALLTYSENLKETSSTSTIFLSWTIPLGIILLTLAIV